MRTDAVEMADAARNVLQRTDVVVLKVVLQRRVRAQRTRVGRKPGRRPPSRVSVLNVGVGDVGGRARRLRTCCRRRRG